jgi:hypothetical protein
MARTRTAENLVLDIRRRAKMLDSEFVDDDEILELYNQERAELNLRLRLAEGQPHFYETNDIQVLAGTISYPTPSDFWELLGAKAVIGGISREMEPFMESERPSLQNTQLIIPYTATPRYRVVATQIDVLPSTQSFTMTIRYVPCAIRMSLGNAPSDTMDGFNGYELACIYGSVAQLLEEEESDSSFWEARKGRILTLIDSVAAQRDAGHPERVTDVVGLDTILPPLFPWK